MKTAAMCPASCGELLQGWMMGGEKLISYAVDLYSRVEIFEVFKRGGRGGIPFGMQKAYRALELVFEHFGYESRESEGLRISIDSEIPVGKGMASSTADICAVIACACKYLGRSMAEDEAARLCAKVEPTDSTVFRKLALFDHVTGERCRDYGQNISANVIVIEGREAVDTMAFHRLGLGDKIRCGEHAMERALAEFENGLRLCDMHMIGRAATRSAIERQRVLRKEGLEQIIEKSIKLGAYGVNVAHSGSVIGVIYDGARMDVERFTAEFWSTQMAQSTIGISIRKIVGGGARAL